MSLPSLWIWILWSSPLAKLMDVGVKMSGSFSLFSRYQICKLPAGRQWDARNAGNLRQKTESSQHSTLDGSFPSPLMRVIASLTAVLKYEEHSKGYCSPIITITIIVVIIYWQFEGNQKQLWLANTALWFGTCHNRTKSWIQMKYTIFLLRSVLPLLLSSNNIHLQTLFELNLANTFYKNIKGYFICIFITIIFL